MRCPISFGLVWLPFLGVGLFSAAPEFEGEVLDVIDANCIDCHSSDYDPAGGLDLERFLDEEHALQHREVWKKVFDKIESKQMPPPKEDAQPSDGERGVVLAWIADAMGRPDPVLGTRDPGKPVLRRLNRLEYNNTLRDLLGLEMDIFLFPERQPITKDYFDPASGRMPEEVYARGIAFGGKQEVALPAAGLPGDGRAEHGFGNRGDVLNLSGLLLEAYMTVASQLLQSEAYAESPFYSRFIASPGEEGEGDDLPGLVTARIEEALTLVFRRPATREELRRYEGLFGESWETGEGFEASMSRALQAALLSPSFLYRSEPYRPLEGKVRALSGFELASRLSYFLWASMPDEELLTLAESGGLEKPAVLVAQARRMMRDKRAREMGDSFAAQWLRLDQLFAAKPDRDLFPHFYSGPKGKNTLHKDALTEALLFFETVMIEDRSILEFIDADFTYMNNGLRRLYGLSPIELDEAERARREKLDKKERRALGLKDAFTWRRTQLEDANRGGVITMPGPLIVTSLPFRTSPVKRGAWLLETIFNRPPDEPKVAFALKDDEEDEVGENLSVRERFEAHRSKPACYSCHVRLDPPGFALEAFDPVGTWREVDNGAPVDASGEWGGRRFEGPAEFKAALLEDPNEFTRGFIEHMLSYALGRELEHYDMPTVAEMQSFVEKEGYRFGAVVEAVVSSYPFRFTRNLPAEPSGSKLAQTR